MPNHAETSPIPAAAPRGMLSIAWGVAATLLSVIYTAVCGPIAATLAMLEKYHAVTVVSRIWGRAIINTCGIDVQMEGLENIAGLKSFIGVANHQSFFDIFALAAYLPGEPRFVAKKELRRIPAVGYAMEHGGHVIIDRESGGKQIRKAVAIIKRGFTVCVFAEGHRFSDNRVHEFNDGAAWLAILTKLPVVPISISGSGGFFPRGAKIVVPGGAMRIAIGKPIPTEGMRSADRTELTQRLEQQVRATFTTDV
ncbi:MAG: lysophospholipid acyltransferase family protein [Candidatus Binatus sp.]|uniref:lysophospholipid acyltransferase family protein n=1 Tax=Candidatus Binatus sp. TaxID=2811406 RepID=UPI002725A40B|nr:lysophospholipid acyltransferase family protein [Candidatus Binatus sp.]MDO8432868.1 lysophospholipid acyltransferase family protein [Candidatus Binatus sp.]